MHGDSVRRAVERRHKRRNSQIGPLRQKVECPRAVFTTAPGQENVFQKCSFLLYGLPTGSIRMSWRERARSPSKCCLSCSTRLSERLHSSLPVRVPVHVQTTIAY